MKLLRRCIQGGYGQIIHGRLGPPQIFRALRHHYNCRNIAAVSTDGDAYAHIGLLQAVFAALASSVKEQYDRPWLAWRPILGHENLISVVSSLQGNRAVEEARFVLFCLSRHRDYQPQN